MRNKSCGNGSKNCVAFRNGIAIGNPTTSFSPCFVAWLTCRDIWNCKTAWSGYWGARNVDFVGLKTGGDGDGRKAWRWEDVSVQFLSGFPQPGMENGNPGSGVPEPGLTQNCKHRRIFSGKYAKYVRTPDVGLKCNQNNLFLSAPPSSTEARYAYMVLRFVIIIAQVNAVTPDWESSLSTSLGASPTPPTLMNV